jgi:hypothetical protein
MGGGGQAKEEQKGAKKGNFHGDTLQVGAVRYSTLRSL